MNALSQLDAVITEIGTLLFAAVPFSEWEAVIMYSRYTPDASTSAHAFDFLLPDGRIDKGASPLEPMLTNLENATKKHWQETQNLGQPRWYKMILTIQRTGKFNVEFEYRDDYKEGDIMKQR